LVPAHHFSWHVSLFGGVCPMPCQLLQAARILLPFYNPVVVASRYCPLSSIAPLPRDPLTILFLLFYLFILFLYLLLFFLRRTPPADTNLSPPPLLAQHPRLIPASEPSQVPSVALPSQGSCRLPSSASSIFGAWTGFSQLQPRSARPPSPPLPPCQSTRDSGQRHRRKERPQHHGWQATRCSPLPGFNLGWSFSDHFLHHPRCLQHEPCCHF